MGNQVLHSNLYTQTYRYNLRFDLKTEPILKTRVPRYLW